MPHSISTTILDRLADHASRHPDQIVCACLQESVDPLKLNYAALDSRARSLAGVILEHCNAGDRALMLYPHGLEFICSFLACLYAGVIAVPALLPRRNHPNERLNRIAADCQPKLVLTTQSAAEQLAPEFLERHGIATRLKTDGCETDNNTSIKSPRLTADRIAFLQYTSGSTGDPKGTIVTHENLVCNVRSIQAAFQYTRDSIMVSWLPLFHDMGLIGGVLQPLFAGFPSILLAPNLFIREPIRWLRAIADFRGTTTGAPNFAYDHCVDHVTDEQKLTIDLSSLTIAYNGSEPIRAATLERFADAFASCGFRKNAFFPCYGMAETTLFTSGGPPQREPRLLALDATELESQRAQPAGQNARKAVTLVGCGQIGHDTRIAMVDPVSRRRTLENQVGEIWIAGGSVARGYWNRETETETTFRAFIADTGEGPFLRTGDLGLILDGELFITGRIKDLIIVRGRNIYPQDVEQAIEQTADFVKPNCCAAYHFDHRGNESLAVALEVSRKIARETRKTINGSGEVVSNGDDPSDGNQNPSIDRLIDRIRQRIVEQFEILPARVTFVQPGALPRTSSGKVQRRATKAGLEKGTLPIVYDWNAPSCAPERQSLGMDECPTSDACTDPEFADVLKDVVDTISAWLGSSDRPYLTVNAGTPIARLGIDSVAAADIGLRLEKKLKFSFEIVSVNLHRTVGDLAEYIHETRRMRVSNSVLERTRNGEASIEEKRVTEIKSTICAAESAGLALLNLDANTRAGRLLTISGRDYLNFVTCSYLGIETQPQIIDAVCNGARQYGASCIVSRAYVSAPEFSAFEGMLASIFDAFPVVTPSTTLGHMAFVSVGVQSGDLLILDRQVHNSVQLAVSTVAGKCQIELTDHNDIENLERLIAANKTGKTWYFCDGIYSMFGDVCPIHALVSLLDKYEKFHCYIDDAHGMSTQGVYGRGYILGQIGRCHEKMVVAVSLSKAFGIGCGGCLVLPHRESQHKIRRCGNTLIFSSPIPPPMLAAAVASAAIHLSPEIEQLQDQLRQRIRLFRTELSENGIESKSSVYSPVQYICLGELDTAIHIAQRLKDRGALVSVCGYPAVPKDECGIRCTMHLHSRLDDVRTLTRLIKDTVSERK